MLAEFELALASLADGGHALDYTVMHRITLSSIGLHCQAVPDRRMPVGSAFYPLPSTLCLLPSAFYFPTTFF